MQLITRERVLVLCRMAREGARDDGGREFVTSMIEAFTEEWAAQDKSLQQQAQSKAAASLKSVEEKARTEAEESLRESLREEIMGEIAHKVAASKEEVSAIATQTIAPPTPLDREYDPSSNGDVKKIVKK